MTETSAEKKEVASLLVIEYCKISAKQEGKLRKTILKIQDNTRQKKDNEQFPTEDLIK